MNKLKNILKIYSDIYCIVLAMKLNTDINVVIKGSLINLLM